MKKLSLSLSAALLLFVMTSCNDKTKTEETNTTATDTTKVAATPAPPAFKPYKGVLVTHTVQDFDKWKAAFDKDDSNRVAAGLTMPGVGRGLDNDKLAVIMMTAADIAKVKAMMGDAKMQEVMKKAGVTGKPTVAFLDVIMDDTSHIPQKERVMVTHHVKDFDTWKKAFDAEGDAARASNGLVLRAMARGTEDANTVTILFAITDMAKAKARVASPDLKKIMTDGGVDGPPTITWFKWVM